MQLQCLSALNISSPTYTLDFNVHTPLWHATTPLSTRILLFTSHTFPF